MVKPQFGDIVVMQSKEGPFAVGDIVEIVDRQRMQFGGYIVRVRDPKDPSKAYWTGEDCFTIDPFLTAVHKRRHP